MFDFVIGPGHNIFQVHAKLVANQSQTLCQMVSGNMKEALERKSAPLEDVSPETFVRVVEYMYTGD